MGLFSQSSCWGCSSQVLQRLYLILLFQPVPFHWCQCIGKSSCLLEHLPTLGSISNLLPEVSLTCCPTISEVIAVTSTSRFPSLCSCSSALSAVVAFPVSPCAWQLCLLASLFLFEFTRMGRQIELTHSSNKPHLELERELQERTRWRGCLGKAGSCCSPEPRLTMSVQPICKIRLVCPSRVDPGLNSTCDWHPAK